MKTYAIELLDKETWKGTCIPVEYQSDEYYDICVQKTENGFQIPIEKKQFEQTFVHDPSMQEYPDRLYEDWWEQAEAFGIIDDGKLLAAIEVCEEEWSKRIWITELFVSEVIRGQGWGRKLIEKAKEYTREKKCRALLLETQSSNANAVDFYMHMGFTLIGFDSCAYTNEDVERHEVRFNMGWFPGHD